MVTQVLSGNANLASSILVTNNIGGGDYNYLIDNVPGSGTADDLIINGGLSGDEILLGGLSAFSGVATLTVNAGGSNDTVIGSALGDVINGDAGDDSLLGGAGNDTIAGDTGGSFGQDTMFGEGGNDVFLVTAGQGQGDVFNGGADTDTVRNIPGQTTTFINVGDANFISIEVLDGSGGSFNGTESDNLLDFSAIATAVNVSGIFGAGGSDTIVSVVGTAVFIDGGAAADSILGNALGESLNGGNDNDTIDGAGGNDTLTGGDGVDRLIGGLGNDTFLIGTATGQGDVFIGGGGTDTVLHTTAGQVLQFLNVGDANFIGVEALNAAGQSITGNASDNLLDFSNVPAAINVASILGDGGADTIVAFGNTAIYVDGGAAADSILGNGLAESLFGGNDNDTINGGGGNDTLRGGDGVDSLFGGLGNDQFRIGQADGQGDIFNGYAGNDTIVHENAGQPLRFLNVGDANFLSIEVLNGGGQVISGNASDNLLDFSAIATAVGVTSILGDGGADTIVAFGNTAIFIDGGAAADSILGNGLAESLDGGNDNDTINGGAGNDTLRGGSGVDLLLGGLGDDQFRIGQIDGQGDIFNGFTGNDTIVHENAGQPLRFLNAGDANFLSIEVLDGGSQVIAGTAGNNLLDFSAIATAVNVTRIDGEEGADTIVGFGFSTVDLVGGAGNDSILGNLNADKLFGDADNDTLLGAAGQDTLDGGAGIDRLLGGLGDDTYLVTAGDLIIEALNQGTDTVRSTINWVLGANIEALDLLGGNAITGTGNALANALRGNDAANTLIGGAGADTLQGEGGSDRLLGGLDNDFYIVAPGDVVVEALNAGDADTVSASGAASFTLASNVETLALTGATVITGIGNAIDNTIIGNANANVLYGMGANDLLFGEAGGDILIGGAGRDTLVGGSEADQFRFVATGDSATATPDLIFDFGFSAATGFDRVDLRLIDANSLVGGDQAFTYIGVAAFGGQGAASAGQLRVATLSPGTYRAQGDVDGNGTADFAVDIVSATGPVAGWFLA